MAEIFTMPLTNVPQTFTTTLADREVDITCRWNAEIEGGWYINIDDTATGAPLIHNLPLVTGSDLLSQYEYIGINGGLIVYTDGDELMPPTYENLGAQSNLYFVTDAPSQ